MTYITGCHSERASCHSERSEESRMSCHPHSGRSSYRTPLGNKVPTFLIPLRLFRYDRRSDFVTVTTSRKTESSHSQTVSHSQSVSCLTSREAATSPRIARPSSLMDKERNNASYHSQNVLCHSSREAATSPRITWKLFSQAPGDLLMTYITAGHCERASCHSERSEESRMSCHPHSGRSSYRTPLGNKVPSFLIPLRLFRYDRRRDFVTVTTSRKTESSHSQTVSHSQSVSCHSSKESRTSPRIARPTRLMATGRNNASGLSQTVSHSQNVSCHSSREAATSPRIARPTRLMGTGKNNASGLSQTVSYSQSVSFHSTSEAATSPRTARPTRLMGTGKNNASGHSQTVSHSQNVSCHSSREAAISPRITRQLVSWTLGRIMRWAFLKPSHILKVSHALLRGELQSRLGSRGPLLSRTRGMSPATKRI